MKRLRGKRFLAPLLKNKPSKCWIFSAVVLTLWVTAHLLMPVTRLPYHGDVFKPHAGEQEGLSPPVFSALSLLRQVGAKTYRLSPGLLDWQIEMTSAFWPMREQPEGSFWIGLSHESPPAACRWLKSFREGVVYDCR